MKMRLSAFSVLVIGCCGLAGTTQAALVEHEIDQDHSAIIFKVKNRGVSYVYGRFNGISGTITIDRPSKPDTIEFVVEVNASSVDTNSKKRDRELIKSDFFDTTKQRKITFKSKACKKLEEEGMYEVTGDLMLLGKTKEMTVVFHLIGTMRESSAQNRIGGETTFTIKRSDFGMDKMLDSIDDEVTLMVNLEAVSKMLPAG